ncbi:hypothetical protein FB451DRAFT_1292546 [Mycena latifolia]|nr:hypothetical protein FB451DRAFT_1292546 [Mycena latifolia]
MNRDIAMVEGKKSALVTATVHRHFLLLSSSFVLCRSMQATQQTSDTLLNKTLNVIKHRGHERAYGVGRFVEWPVPPLSSFLTGTSFNSLHSCRIRQDYCQMPPPHASAAMSCAQSVRTVVHGPLCLPTASGPLLPSNTVLTNAQARHRSVLERPQDWLSAEAGGFGA